MSIEALNWAFKQNVTPAGKKLVLVALADTADQHGMCFPSYDHIAAKTSLSRRSVIDAVKALADEGTIEKAPRFRPNTSSASNAYRIPIPCEGLADHPLISWFSGEGANPAPPRVQISHPPSANPAPPLTTNITKKEKNALARDEFLRGIDQGRLDGRFDEWQHLTEAEIRYAAHECWDFWAAQAAWPGGDPVAVLRNWIRGGIRKGHIRKAGKPDTARSDGSTMSADDQRWALRVKGWLNSGVWQEGMWGPPPDMPGCKVPPPIMTEFFPDGKIPATQTA
jgi:hypothetical protein